MTLKNETFPDPENRLYVRIRLLSGILLSHCSVQHRRPCLKNNDRQIIPGASLTQNCSRTPVACVIENLRAKGRLSPGNVLAVHDPLAEEAICCAGFYKQKCSYLKPDAEYFLRHKAHFRKEGGVLSLRRELSAEGRTHGFSGT